MHKCTKQCLNSILVWLCRFVVGGTFIVSGWAKAIDPRGFIIKINEYLTVWGLSIPREIVFTACVALASFEFVVGVLLLGGSLKKTAALLSTVFMAFMLPLTLYIALKNPVADCGCFGDLFIISNWATFAKNVIITAMTVFLLFRNSTVTGVYAPPIQWLTIVVSVIFTLFLSLSGYFVQPLVDFRPYKVGTKLFDTEKNSTYRENDTYYVYEKDGEQRRFALSDIPDSTWTYVDVIEEHGTAMQENRGFDVRDVDGYDVSDELADKEGAVLYLIISNPDFQFLSRSHYANRLCEYAAKHNVEMIGIAGMSGSSLMSWIELTRPYFQVYSADNTALKQLVRGDAALVYTIDGTIEWKRSLSSMDNRLPDDTSARNALDKVRSFDDGRIHSFTLGAYLLSMLIIYLLSFSPKILRFFVRLAKKNN